MPAASDKSAAPSNAHDVRSATTNAALRGALRAFARPPSSQFQPNPTTVPPSGTASRALRTRRPPPRPAASSRSVDVDVKNGVDQSQGQEDNLGSAAGARARLDSLDSPSSLSNVTSADGPTKPAKPLGLANRPTVLKLAIPASALPEDGVVKAQGLAPEIQSPKPIRPVQAAASIEAVTNEHTPQTLKPEVPSDDGIVGFSEVSANTQPASASRPEPPPTRKAEPEIPADPPAAPLMPSRSHSTSHLARSATMRPDRERRGPGFMSQKSAQMQHRKVTPTTYQAGHDDPAQRIEALANAIVASHLASSRGPSPAKSPGPVAPLLQRRQTEKPVHHFHHFKSNKADSRTPSPAKRMRHTLRKPPSDEDDEEQPFRRPRGHFHLRQHPNKHHEGDRKRWRDEITYRERKRYEGVWAANRDLFMRYTAEELQSPDAVDNGKGSVSSVVVKDVWSRSRLPEHALEEIWDLVDRKQVGRLDREEFVVGLWLVDQRLKGRKVPVKVGNSVWQSVRGIYGLKVPKRKE